jgi:flavin reductase (DIM6/NTAB) family NADH-FMN oxidoreductase RutF
MKKDIKRRKFIKQSAATALLAGISSFGFHTLHATSNLKGERELLAEASPMIPPVPAILLTVNGDENVKDEISVVWTFVVNGIPPQIGISVHHEHVAGSFIRKHKDFVLNLPTTDIIKSFDVVDMNSGKTGDKFALGGLTRERAKKVNAPSIAESPIHVECNVTHTFDIAPVRTVFIADVIATTVLEGVCDANGKLIVDQVPFFGMTAGSGEFYTMGKRVGHIGESLGRDDIKY